MLRTCALAAALLALTLPAGAEGRTSSWSSERMRLTARPKLPPYDEELRGNCAGLKVMLTTRIEWLKGIEEKAAPRPWPPPSPMARWATPPVGGAVARQRERIARLNAALRAKGCETVDVEAELRRPTASGRGARTR